MHCPEIRDSTFLHIMGKLLPYDNTVIFIGTALRSRKGNPSPVLLNSSDVLVILGLSGFEQITIFTFLQFYVI
jgi:hypothetical protein